MIYGFSYVSRGSKRDACENFEIASNSQKVGSKPERPERVYKRTAQAQRDFLRKGGTVERVTDFLLQKIGTSLTRSDVSKPHEKDIFGISAAGVELS